MYKGLSEYIKHKDDIVNLCNIERYSSFNEWDQDRKQNKIKNRLYKYLGDYEKSPEEILIEKERQKEYTHLLWELKKHIGTDNLKILWMYYVDCKSADDISKYFHCSKRTVYRRIRLSMQRAIFVAKVLLDHTIIDKDIFFATTHISKPITIRPPSFPFEMAIHTPAYTYKYKNEHKVKYECKLPEYLHECTGTDDVKCSLCYDQYGNNSCSRKDYYRNVT